MVGFGGQLMADRPTITYPENLKKHLKKIKK